MLVPEKARTATRIDRLATKSRFAAQVNDPNLQPRMEPRPADDVLFLHGLLEGIATVEARTYMLLAEMGASTLSQVVALGVQHPDYPARPSLLPLSICWRYGIGVYSRWRCLCVPVSAAANGEAAYGCALLARRSLVKAHLDALQAAPVM